MFLVDIIEFSKQNRREVILNEQRLIKDDEERKRKNRFDNYRTLGTYGAAGVGGSLYSVKLLNNNQRSDEYFKNLYEKNINNINSRYKNDKSIKDDIRMFLNIDPDVQQDAKLIKSAYRKNAAKYHPDTGGNKEVFNRFNNAYDSMKGGSFKGTPMSNLDKKAIDYYSQNISKLNKAIKQAPRLRNLAIGGAVLSTIPIGFGVRGMWKNRKQKEAR